MDSRDAVEGGLPRRESKSHAGIGLPGGRRQVKMPDTVRSGAMPPRASHGAGLPSRKDARVAREAAEGAQGLPGRSTPVASSSSPESGLPSRGEGAARERPASEGSALPVRKTIEDAREPRIGLKGLPSPSQGEGSPRVSFRDREASMGQGVSLPAPKRVEEAPVVSSPSPVVSSPVQVEVPRVEVAPVERVTEGGGASSHGGYREPTRKVLAKSPLAGSETWDDEDVPDTHLGLNAEAAQPKKVAKKKAKLALTKRDIEIITLCARYRFAYREQIQHYFQSENVRNRLTRLADEGLLRKDMVTQNQALWLPSQAGLDVADLDLTHIERGRYSATSIAHSIGLLNLGIEFEKGWENLLKEDVWPNLNRVDRNGNRLQGETVITEREITNSFNRLKGIAKGDARKTADVSSELLKLRNDALSEIPAPGKLSLEMREGMAGLFVGYFQNKSHTPDMVIARPRSQDGSSNHIAIELELNPKPIPDWIRILRSFKADPMFKSVIYFTHKRSINNQLTEVNKKHVGLTPEQFKIFKYTPRNDSIPFWG